MDDISLLRWNRINLSETITIYTIILPSTRGSLCHSRWWTEYRVSALLTVFTRINAAPDLAAALELTLNLTRKEAKSW